jgi:hypothetical protein
MNNLSVDIASFPIIPIAYVLDGSDKPWIVIEDINYVLSNGDSYLVEKHFRFDGTSSPRFLWSTFPPVDDRILGVILHDHMYAYDYLLDVMEPREAKKWIDNEMELWFNKYLDKKKLNRAMKIGVKLFGWKIFMRRKKQQ